ncbi:MAG: PDC sensor domain-containing protein [Prevotella sp.]|nr:PDC sensor domain-containing protein [Prevotella sp.]
MKKYIVMLVVSAAIMLVMMAAIPFYMAKESAEMELLAKAERDLMQSKRIATVKAEVEKTVANVTPKIRQRIDFPDRFYTILVQMVSKNKYIVGAGVAFVPDYYTGQGKEKLYAPYAYDEEPSVTLQKKKTDDPQIRTRLLDFDYTTRDWYKRPIAKEVSFWTQPYVDQGGTKIIMCTYVEPIRDRDNRVVGVLFADVPMEDVSLLSMELESDIERGGRISLMVMLVFLVLFCLILWLAVNASRQHSRNAHEAEKQQLNSEIEHLRALNRKLTERNLELSKMARDNQFFG